MMRQLKLVFVSMLLGVSTAHASEAFIGQFLYQYDGGNVYRVKSDDNTMRWECIEGSEKGANGTEKPERLKVDSKIYFVSWVEKTGIQVSQVINLKSMKVYSTIVDGKERYVLKGNIVREK